MGSSVQEDPTFLEGVNEAFNRDDRVLILDGRNEAHSNESKGSLVVGLASWLTCSAGMLVFNKLAIKALPTPCSLVGLQFAFAVLVMLVCCYHTLHIGSLHDVLRWAMVVPFFTGMILTSILALQHAPMTLVITFRALSPAISLIAEAFYPDPIRVSPTMILCLCGMLVGVGLYVWDMDRSSLHGMWWAVLNNFLAVGDRLLQRLMLSRDQSPVNISKTGVTLLNNLLGCVPLFIAVCFTNELAKVPGAIQDLDLLGWAVVIASCIVGVGINYAGIWVQSLITATSFLVLVNASKFAIVFVEAFVMKENALQSTQIIGSVISILASIGYGRAQERAGQEGWVLCLKEPVAFAAEYAEAAEEEEEERA